MDEIIHVQALIQGHVKALIQGIEGAIDLLEAPGSWTQHALARNGQGTPVSGMSPEATQYCIRWGVGTIRERCSGQNWA